MIDDDRRDVALKVREVAEKLARIAGSIAYRNTRHGLHGVDAVLRCLHDDLVIHARNWIEPLIGCGLPSTRQRDQHALRDILLCKTDLPCFQSIHIHVYRGFCNLLVNVRVRNAGNGLHLP